MLCMKTHPNTVLEIRFNWKNPWKLLVGLKLINYLTELTCPAIGHIIVQKYTLKKKKTKSSSYRKTFFKNKKSEIEVTVLGNVKQQLRLFINLFPVHQSAKVY
jgi:hypothetical protein